MIRINIKETIRAYFFMNPTAKVRLRHLERETNLPFPSVVRYAKELAEEDILKISLISGVKLYSADRTSKRFLLEKKMFNIRRLYDCDLIDYIIEEYNNPAIVLFGSFSKGEDIEKSDIDIYIQTPQKTIKNLDKFEKKLQRKIQIFQSRKLTEIKNKDLANNIVNGVVLNGFMEVFE